jgi:hypothetical protein
VRRCLFCPTTKNLSREHVIPQWIVELDGLGDLKTEKMQFLSVHSPTHGKADLPIRGVYVEPTGKKMPWQNWQLKKVCRSCNNGWMAEIEGRAQRPLATLITSTADPLPLAFSDSEREDIARWAWLRALLFADASPSFFERDWYARMRKRQLPLGIWVELSHSRSIRFDGTVTPTPLMSVHEWDKPLLQRISKVFRLVAFKMGRLVFRVSWLDPQAPLIRLTMPPFFHPILRELTHVAEWEPPKQLDTSAVGPRWELHALTSMLTLVPPPMWPLPDVGADAVLAR